MAGQAIDRDHPDPVDRRVRLRLVERRFAQQLFAQHGQFAQRLRMVEGEQVLAQVRAVIPRTVASRAAIIVERRRGQPRPRQQAIMG